MSKNYEIKMNKETLKKKLDDGYELRMTEYYGSFLHSIVSPDGEIITLPDSANTISKLDLEKELIKENLGIKTWKLVRKTHSSST